MGFDWKRVGLGVATGGGSELVRYGYNEAFGKPAAQQQAAYNDAAQDVSQIGQRAARGYDQRGQTAINRFDRAGGVMDRYFGGGGAAAPSGGGRPPTSFSAPIGGSGYSRTATTQPQYSYGPLGGTPPAGGGFTNPYQVKPAYSGTIKPLGQPTGGGTRYSSAPGGIDQSVFAPTGGGGAGGGGAPAGPTGGQQSSGAYDDARSRYGQSYTSDFLRDYSAPTAAQDYAQDRRTNGYGPNQVADRYAARSGSAGPQYLEGALGELGGFARGGTAVGSRAGELRGEFAAPDALDRRLGERQDFARGPTTTSGALGAIEGLSPGQYGAEFAGRLGSGATAGGELIRDIRSGDTEGGRFASYLQGPDSASGQFLGGFDPNATRGLGDTYNALASEGPQYEEDFYTSQLAGKNPAYEMLKQDATRDARNAAAARGGFASSKAIDSEERTSARLAAEEFSRRGDLAAAAGGARRASQGLRLGAAEALDSNLLGRAGLFSDTALRREGMLGDVAGQGDSMRAGLAGQQDELGAGLAMHRDDSEMERADMRLRGAGQQDDLLRRDQDALDSISGKLTDRDLSRSDQLNNLASSEDSTRTSRMSDFAGRLGEADTNRMTFDRDIDTLSDRAATQSFDREKQTDDVFQRGIDEYNRGEDRRLTASTAADSDRRQQDTNLGNLARDASSEFRDNFKTEFDAAMQMGNAQAGMQMAYDMASMGALTQADLSAIETKLAAAGVPLATRQAFANNLMQLGGMALKA